MDPYIQVVQTLFDYARAQFKEVTTYYFHNTVYDYVWADPPRVGKPQKVDDFSGFDPEIRLIMVGDASMAPFELMLTDGSIHIEERSGRPSFERLRLLSECFPHCVWLNPTPAVQWAWIPTIGRIQQVFPMFELSLDGLEKAVAHLVKRN